MFNSFDVQRKQEITFTDFVIGLSVLTRGTIDEQLRWIFTLYDLNGDGIITRDELNKIVNSIHDLMGKFSLNSNQQQQQQNLVADSSGIQSQQQQTRQNDSPTARDISQNLNQQPSSGKISSEAHQANQNKSSSLSPSSTLRPYSSLTSNEDQAENLFRKFDLNNDGIITLDEFLEACYKVSY